MTKYKDTTNTDRLWLHWCRLCANDNAAINVGQKDIYMRIISKCFDIEIGFEEPELGSMLCSDCYGVIGELLNFMENVNKVQPIFELLRHTEPSEHLDMSTLRQQYGLPERNTEHFYKMEPTEVAENVSSREASLEPERHIYFEEIDSSSQLELPSSPVPVKRKRGRPKGSKKIKSSSMSQSTMESLVTDISTNFHDDPSNIYEETIEANPLENGVWLNVDFLEQNKTTIKGETKRKRGRPRLYEKKEIQEDLEELDDEFGLASPNYSILSVEETQDQKPEVSPPNQEVKRKRGRPRKQEAKANYLNSEPYESHPKCKNIALARLLASPDLVAEDSATDEYDPNDIDWKKELAVKCDVCHKELSSETGLKYHIERVHLKKKPFVCDVCGKSVRTVSELKEHMLVHTDDRPFVCSICNAAFKNQKRLNIHGQTHGAPSYECEICGKKLQTRAIWNKHKNVHTNERRFKCSICGTATKNSTALKIHLLSHTGLRPYRCKYCNKDFASGANCREHKMKKHPNEYEQDADKSCRIQCVPTLDELRALAAGMAKGERLRKQKNIQIE